jgi:hypothetical protein
VRRVDGGTLSASLLLALPKIGGTACLHWRAVDAVSGDRLAVGIALIVTRTSDDDFNAGHDHSFLTIGPPYRRVLAA